MSNNWKHRLFSTRMIISIILVLLFTAIQFLFLRLSGISVFISAFDAGTLFLLALLFTIVIRIIQQHYHTSEVLNSTNISTVILFGIITALLSHVIGTNSFKTNQLYLDFVNYTALIRSLIIILIYTIIMIIFWMEKQQIESMYLQHIAIENERTKNQIELNSLQQQLKPHFLFNSLNSIHALIRKNPEEASEMLILLSEFMRNSVKTDSELIRLSDEIDILKKYIRIEQVRFGERLNFDLSIEKKTGDYNIPSFLLQPLIENAIKYGLYGSIETITISLHGKANMNDDLEITICNPFEDDSQKTMKGTGFGINSVKKKLALLFGRNDLLEISIAENLFCVTLIIPQS